MLWSGRKNESKKGHVACAKSRITKIRPYLLLALSFALVGSFIVVVEFRNLNL